MTQNTEVRKAPGRSRAAAHARGVVVLGMHRSGTSAVAGLLHLAGVPLPGKRYLVGRARHNVKGHWEIQPLNKLNERVLRLLGGDWSAPPGLAGAWAEDPRLRRLRSRARKVFTSIMPPDSWLWKDPRLCLMLPFWREVASDAIVVLVVRNPLEVSRSLQHRNGFSHPLALALWERYTAGAARAAHGRAAMVVPYDRVLQDPAGWCRESRAWLEGQGVPCRSMADPGAVEALIDPGLRHSSHSLDDLRADPLVSPQQEALHAALLAAVGTHSSFPTLDLPDATPWAGAIIDERRPGRKLAHRHHRWRREAGSFLSRVVRRS